MKQFIAGFLLAAALVPVVVVILTRSSGTERPISRREKPTTTATSPELDRLREALESAERENERLRAELQSAKRTPAATESSSETDTGIKSDDLQGEIDRLQRRAAEAKRLENLLIRYGKAADVITFEAFLDQADLTDSPRTRALFDVIIKELRIAPKALISSDELWRLHDPTEAYMTLRDLHAQCDSMFPDGVRGDDPAYQELTARIIEGHKRFEAQLRAAFPGELSKYLDNAIITDEYDDEWRDSSNDE